MDLKLMLEGYRFVCNEQVLENYHYNNINKLKKQYYDEIKIGNIVNFAEDLTKISMAYREQLKIPKKIKSNYRNVVFICTQHKYSDFYQYYHNSLFIVLGDLEDKLYYNKIINDDCQVLFYPIELINSRNLDGMYSYLLYNLIDLSMDITNINIFVDNSEYFQGLIGSLNHYHINTDCYIFRTEINLMINEIRKLHCDSLKNNQMMKIMKKLNITNDYNEIIDELFDIGFCFYNDKNKIVYLREFI